MGCIVEPQVFTDVSVFGSLLGWDLGFRPLSSGDTRIEASAVVGEHVTVTRLDLSLRYHQLGVPPPGTLWFGVPISPMRDWFGRPYQSESVLPFNQASGIDGVSDEGFRAMTLSISRAFLIDVASSCRIEVPASLLEPSADTLLQNSNAVRRLRARLTHIMSFGPYGPEWMSDVTLDLLRAASTHLALKGGGSGSLPSSQALAKALDFIREHRRSPIGVQDLCGELGIAARTMNRAFNERFGVGPKAYLKRQRLAGARSELLHSPSTAVISDVANRWGFWHLGQFAKDYRTLFGELPSETRRLHWVLPESQGTR
jgi:AraC-like DNA-binding protein